MELPLDSIRRANPLIEDVVNKCHLYTPVAQPFVDRARIPLDFHPSGHWTHLYVKVMGRNGECQPGTVVLQAIEQDATIPLTTHRLTNTWSALWWPVPAASHSLEIVITTDVAFEGILLLRALFIDCLFGPPPALPVQDELFVDDLGDVQYQFIRGDDEEGEFRVQEGRQDLLQNNPARRIHYAGGL